LDSNNDRAAARRSFLRLAGGTLGATCLAFNWSEIARAAAEAATEISSGSRATKFLTIAEAADLESICAQIIPTDSTPGAREAGVLFFVDRALMSFYARQAAEFRSGLAEFQGACRQWRPRAASFAALPPAEQIEFLRTVDHTPFFDSVRALTVIGMFSSPAYGGNRDGAGWKLLGFEDLHAFQPPFGYYDRDYPGFVSGLPKPT
jgi:gluconate 2-dehydrogenase gamma chain